MTAALQPKNFSNHWKTGENFFQSLEKSGQIFQPLENFFPIIGKNARSFPTIGKNVSNHWKIFSPPVSRRKGFCVSPLNHPQRKVIP